jgi:hypothetical protein
VAEWFKAPVLKFGFARFVQFWLVLRDVVWSDEISVFIPADPLLALLVLECW